MKNKFIKIIACILIVTALAFSTLTGCKTEKTFEGITLTDVTVTYNQASHNVIVNGLDNYPDATVVLDDEKTDVGEYIQKIKVSQQGYKDFTASAKLIIKKATALNLYPQHEGDFSFNEGTNTLFVVYTGNPINITAFTNYEQRDLAIITYSLNGENLSSAPVEAGDYQLVITLPETKNYTELSKTFNLKVVQPQYNVTFKVLNPETNELEDLGAKTYQRNSQIELTNLFNMPEYDGYVFEKWYCNDEEVHTVFDYGKDVTFIAKYKSAT